MNLIHKLKAYENSFVHLKWAAGSEFGKIKYVGSDFIEFQALNCKTMEYDETILINHQLILEVVIQGVDVSRIIAELSLKTQ